jgi:6-pyruvoyl-tetrahydropterin synthase
MLPLNRLREYQVEVAAQLFDEHDNKMFNYCDMVVDDSELSKILKERVPDDNTFLIAVVPEFNMKGEEDRAKWENILQFFILDKTDYSDHDRDGYLNIFVTTQVKAQAFVNKLLEDKSNHDGMFCGFLSWLDENSIRVYPVWKKDGCNGWAVEINLDTPL